MKRALVFHKIDETIISFK